MEGGVDQLIEGGGVGAERRCERTGDGQGGVACQGFLQPLMRRLR